MNCKVGVVVFRVAVLSFLIVVSGCSLLNKPSAFEAAIQSSEGMSAEEILPEDVFMMLSLNKLDRAEAQQFDEILQRFSRFEPAKNLFYDFLNRELEPFSLDYEQDVRPALGENSRLVLAVSQDKTKETGSSFFYHFIAYLKTPNDGKVIFEKLKKSALFVEEIYDDMSILIEPAKGDNSLYVFIYKDLMVAGNGYERAKFFVDTARNSKRVLLKKRNFEKITKELAEPHTVLAYLDMSAFDSADTDENSDGQVRAVAALINADSRGLAVQTLALHPAGAAEITPERYLYKALPGDDLIVYFEGYNLKDLFLKIAQFGAERNKSFEALYSFGKNSFKQVTSRDFEKDFLGLMDKGFALAFQNNGSKIVPGISLVTDSSSNPELAREFVSRLDAQIDEYLLKLQKKAPEVVSAITKERVAVSEGAVNSLKLDFNKLRLNDVGRGFSLIPLAFFSETVIFYYGLLPDNRLVFSTYQRFPKDYGSETLEANEGFQELEGVIFDYKLGLGYANMKELTRYLDAYANFYGKINAANQALKMKLVLNFLKDDLKAISGVIAAMRREGLFTVGQGLIKVEELAKDRGDAALPEDRIAPQEELIPE